MSKNTKMYENTKKKWYQKIPNTYVILFLLVCLAAVLTWILPAGEYTRKAVAGVSRPIVVSGSYHQIKAHPAGIFEVFKAIPQGFAGSAGIIAIIMLSTGAFTVINKTGALEAGVGVLLNRVRKGRMPGIAVIWIICFLFAALGIIVGPEIQIPFTTISVAIALGLGYDIVVGLAMIMGAGFTAFATAPVNASLLGTAHSIVGLPIFSGFGFRTVMWFVSTLVVCIMVTIYANRVKKDPQKSYVREINVEGLGFSKDISEYKISKRHIGVLLVIVLLFAAIIVGSSKLGWYLDEMSALFVIAGILAGLVYGLKINEIVGGFLEGFKITSGVALILAIARGIQVILDNGKIMDTIVHTLSAPLAGFAPAVSAVGMFLMTMVIHFFIPSGSALSVTVMPIFSPLAEVLGISQQTAVLCMQLGGSLPNIIFPTIGAMIAMCGLARVPFEKWLKFAVKLFLMTVVVAIVFILIAVLINLGPF